MRIACLKIENFRGIQSGELYFPKYAVLVGDNNCGKSTLLEAIDLCLGPERLSRRPVIDEHDFYAGCYLDMEKKPVSIKVEVTVVDLSEAQTRHFRDHLEWWSDTDNKLLDSPPAEGTDQAGVTPALRVFFSGNYEPEEDDFEGKTYFASPEPEAGEFDQFRTTDKRLCGFLFLRTLRTGARALSMERGSLMDIILRLQQKRLQMWEDVLEELRRLAVAEKEELGVTGILTAVQDAIRAYVPSEWSRDPHVRVSDLTREGLRRSLTVFMSTGARALDGSEYSAPFQHQGTGTINTLVLSLLSLIAELKQNVIFAMEEPEIALPPHIQRRIIESVCKKSAQAIFTSHSPYVISEFKPSDIVILRREGGVLSGVRAEYPPAVKPKAYRAEFRSRFGEALLARRVLVLEGRTEFDALPAAARRLHELHPDEFKTLEALGLACIDAQTDSQVAPLGGYFRKLGKTVFAVFDKQEATELAAITSVVHHPFESPQHGFEDVILQGTAEAALRRFGLALVADDAWPPHLSSKTPAATMPLRDLRQALGDFFHWSKGHGTAADLLGMCSRDEMPDYIVETLSALREIIEPTPSEHAQPDAAGGSTPKAEEAE